MFLSKSSTTLPTPLPSHAKVCATCAPVSQIMTFENQVITIHAGQHDRNGCPVQFSLPEPLPLGEWQLIAEDGMIRSLQPLHGNEVATIVDGLSAGES